jgi:DNA-directed RNA polymerase specialized sigma24 family protein
VCWFIRAQANVEGLREPAKILGWLLRITHNLCIDYLRARQSARIDDTADPELALFARVEACVQSDLECAEMSACVRDQVEQLPETDRWAILLPTSRVSATRRSRVCSTLKRAQ